MRTALLPAAHVKAARHAWSRGADVACAPLQGVLQTPATPAHRVQAGAHRRARPPRGQAARLAAPPERRVGGRERGRRVARRAGLARVPLVRAQAADQRERDLKRVVRLGAPARPGPVGVRQRAQAVRLRAARKACDRERAGGARWGRGSTRRGRTVRPPPPALCKGQEQQRRAGLGLLAHLWQLTCTQRGRRWHAGPRPGRAERTGSSPRLVVQAVHGQQRGHVVLVGHARPLGHREARVQQRLRTARARARQASETAQPLNHVQRIHHHAEVPDSSGSSSIIVVCWLSSHSTGESMEEFLTASHV